MYKDGVLFFFFCARELSNPDFLSSSETANNPGIRSWKNIFVWLNSTLESHWWYQLHKEAKIWDSTTWFRIWQLQTPACYFLFIYIIISFSFIYFSLTACCQSVASRGAVPDSRPVPQDGRLRGHRRSAGHVLPDRARRGARPRIHRTAHDLRRRHEADAVRIRRQHGRGSDDCLRHFF